MMLVLQPLESEIDIIEPSLPGRPAELSGAIAATEQIQEQDHPTVLGEASGRLGDHPPAEVHLSANGWT